MITLLLKITQHPAQRSMCMSCRQAQIRSRISGQIFHNFVGPEATTMILFRTTHQQILSRASTMPSEEDTSPYVLVKDLTTKRHTLHCRGGRGTSTGPLDNDDGLMFMAIKTAWIRWMLARRCCLLLRSIPYSAIPCSSSCEVRIIIQVCSFALSAAC